MRWFHLLAATTVLVAADPAVPCEPDIGIEDIRAHLFLTHNGTLSDDILAEGSGFVGWNTIIADELTRGPADDVLVVVEVSSGSEDYIADPLEIWVTASQRGPGEDGGPLVEIGRRTVQGMVLGSDGRASAALYLPDSTCAGQLTIHARLRGEERTRKLHLYCGE
uniref:hypothetical protein n=1 Tax=Parerythrobacter lutipelagi TaxID=1964208 RepID=UPI0010F5B6E9|nr:hypothetical protein [Parerythrobacter lutipelagi]